MHAHARTKLVAKFLKIMDYICMCTYDINAVVFSSIYVYICTYVYACS